MTVCFGLLSHVRQIPGTTFSLSLSLSIYLSIYLILHLIHYCKTCICCDLYVSHDIVQRSANTKTSCLTVHIFSARGFVWFIWDENLSLSMFVVYFLTISHSINFLVQGYINPGCRVTLANKMVW